jgi:PA14 domain/Chitobiase/beta-hexosaminidase C-terminal domain
MTPIAVTGWNRDVIVESNAVGPPWTAYASEFAPGTGQVFYQTGLTSTHVHVWGLPPSGNFASMVGDGTLFSFQPYTANNALVLSSGTGLNSGTLTLVTPATYGSLAILSSSVNGTNQTGSLKLTFNDASSVTLTYFTPDWQTGTYGVAWFGNGILNLTNDSDSGGTQNPRYYQTTVNLTALLGSSNKPLASITFGQSQSAATAIYCVSGVLAGNTMPVAQPIAATGYNRDLVIENTATGPPYTNYAAELNPGEGMAFYQSGLPGKTYGFPASGSFSSAVDGTIFQFQPYTANNALVMSTDTGITHGNLTLTTGAVYDSLSVLANSASGGGIPTVTINFADGSSLVTNFNAPDWFVGVQDIALSGFERIVLTTGATSGAPSSPRLYQTTYDLTALYGATNKAISSLTFNMASAAKSTAIYAISGVRGNQQPGPTYQFAGVTNLPASAIQARSATVNGNITSFGGAVPEVFVYYGTSDGHTNPTAWSQKLYLGGQAGQFSNTLSGLTANTTYYYTMVAINPAGSSWAGPSQSFTTATPLPASVTNYPATVLGPNAALLSGTVLTNGNDAPTVTLFYGPSNGGTNSGAWANSLVLAGAQNGWFGQAVTGLSASTTYYFSAHAVNAGGTSWGTPVQTFTTPAATATTGESVSVLTSRNDNGRTGQNTNETILTPANVNTNTFGKLFSYPLDGYLLAQPLIMPNVNIPGKGLHNVVFAATQNNSVYAFDADSNAGSNSAPLWQTSFINPSAGITPLQSAIDLDPSSSPGFYGPNVGISGTPAIDPATGTIYAVAKTKEVVNNVTNFYYRVHALDVTTGAEKFGGPVVIQGSVPGVGDGFVYPGTVAFDTFRHMNRPALLFANGTLYVLFTSHQDYPPYHGWVFAYNGYTLQQTGIFNTTPNGSGGGIWQSISGPCADTSGNIYFETGNGNYDDTHDNYGDTVLKLSGVNGLSLADYFTPYNQLSLNLADLDIGSAGLILLPDSAGSVAHPHLLVAGSKAGVFWLLDRDNMGQFNPDADTQIVQEVSGATHGMWCTPAYWNGAIYYAASGDNLKRFTVSNAAINTTPASQSTSTIPGNSSPMVSSSGTSNGIVWVLDTSGSQSSPSILHAYNATNVAVEYYNSSQNLTRDNPGNAVKWTMPTIANGKVYVGSVNGLAVFGNLSPLPAPIIAPNGGLFTNSVSVSITDATNTAAIHYTLDGSVPTTNSPVYTGPFVLTNSTDVTAVATSNGVLNSAAAFASFINVNILGNGTGLQGQYYGNTIYNSNAFTGTPIVRIDPTINFNWNTNSPDPSMATNNYTVRWTGMVQPLFNETYTFSTTTDDGVRLWVNGQLLVDHWVPQSPTTWSGQIALNALQLYPIEMDYFQAGGGAIAQLAWNSPSTGQGIIPQSQLYPFTNTLPVLFTSSGTFSNGNFTLQLSGMPGKSYVLQASTNLVNWVPVSTNVPPATIQNLIDPGATNFPTRFYRAVQLP